MRLILLTAFVLTLFGCSKNSYTNEDLEGRWKLADSSINLQMIFSNDSLWMYHPAQKASLNSEETRILDSLSLAHNLYRYKINGDTIKYLRVSFTQPQVDTTNIQDHTFTIGKLTSDSLILSEFNSPNQLRFIRVK